ncbi:unnamed protein product, partial [Trichogramma brassicae]
MKSKIIEFSSLQRVCSSSTRWYIHGEISYCRCCSGGISNSVKSLRAAATRRHRFISRLSSIYIKSVQIHPVQFSACFSMRVYHDYHDVRKLNQISAPVSFMYSDTTTTTAAATHRCRCTRSNAVVQRSVDQAAKRKERKKKRVMADTPLYERERGNIALTDVDKYYVQRASEQGMAKRLWLRLSARASEKSTIAAKHN